MFAKRNSRPQENEELVPHGLVWQAMAEPSAAEKTNSDALQTAKETRLTEVPPRQDDVIAKTATGALVPKKPAASSTPLLFWRSQKIARPEVVKPMAPAASSPSPQTKPVLIQPVRKKDDAQILRTAELPADQEPALARISAHLAKASHEISERGKAVARITLVRRYIERIGHGAVVWFKWLHEKLPDGHRFSELRNHIDRVRSFMVAQTRAAVVRFRLYSEKFRVRTVIFFTSVVTYARRQAERVRSLPVERRQLVIEDQPTRLDGPDTRKSKHAQVRIRLVGLPLQARILVARAISEWKLKRDLLHDSRLWTSMAMVALSAMLALGLISTVRHYATHALPSHLSHADSSPALSLPPAAKVAPLKPTANRVHPVQRVSQPRLIQRKRIDRAPVIKPKPHHSEDDDYVARDTYVYYGNKPNGSR